MTENAAEIRWGWLRFLYAYTIADPASGSANGPSPHNFQGLSSSSQSTPDLTLTRAIARANGRFFRNQ